MGILLSRVRKKKSALEVLEKLDHDIKEIEENRKDAQRKYKRISKLLLVWSLGLYVLCGVFFYFQFTSTLREKLLYLVPLVISPLLLYILKRIISWYFVRLLNKNQTRLNEMKKEKKRILDEVMDKETYKVAKQILEKFSEDPAPKMNYNMQLTPLNQTNNGLKRRTVTTESALQRLPPVKAFGGSQASQQLISTSNTGRRPMTASPTPMLRFPAPILPLQRTYMDRVVEYLIGDGPNNRYALICSQCHSHNGMALKEEFEYIGFKCCYCFHYNPARKIKPEAPKLENPFKLKRDSESDSERTSGENSEAEDKPPSAEVSPRIQNLETSNNIDSGTVEMRKNELESNLTSESGEKEPTDIATSENPPEKESNDSAQPEATESNTNCDESLVKT